MSARVTAVSITSPSAVAAASPGATAGATGATGAFWVGVFATVVTTGGIEVTVARGACEVIGARTVVVGPTLGAIVTTEA